MASKDLSITDVFPMRKRRALGLATTKQNQHDSENARGEKPKPQSCLLETPITKASSSKKKPKNSPIGRNDKQLPVKTPTRPNVSPAALLGRLRKTPQRLAAWKSLSGCDSGPEIIWDNDCHSPTNALDHGSINGNSSKVPMQGQLAFIIKKISKDCKKSISKVETNLFDSWMKKDDGEDGQSSKPADRQSKKKKSVIHKPSCGDNPEPKMPRRTRKWSRMTSNNAVKIKEELSNFIKDINERENLNAANSEEERLGKEMEKSDHLRMLNEHLALEHVDLDLSDDNDWLDHEDLPAELKECGASESVAIGQVEYPKGDLRRKMTGDFEAQVAANLLTCTTGTVYSSGKCKTDWKDSDPGNEADCYVKKNVKRGVHKENDCIHQGIAVHRHEDREGGKLFEDVSKVASLTSQKHKKHKEGKTTCLQEKQHFGPTKLKQTSDVGAKSIGWEKRNVVLPLEIGKSLKHNGADFVKCSEQPFAERKLVPDVKRELLTARGEQENEFNESVNSEDEYIFDELEDDIIAEKCSGIYGIVMECNSSGLECEDFGEDLCIAEENENESKTAKKREPAKASCEFKIDEKQEDVLKGNVLSFDGWFEIDNDLNEIDFDDNGDLFNGSYVNDCENLHKAMAGLGNVKKFLTSESQIKTKCLGKNCSIENTCNTKGCVVECEKDKTNVSSSKNNCNLQHGGRNGRENRSKIAPTCAAVTNIRHEIMGTVLNIETEERGLVATKGCKDSKGNAKLHGVVEQANQKSLATVGKSTEVAKFGKLYVSSVDDCLKKQLSSPSGLREDDNVEFHAKNCILNNDSLIEIDFEMADWNDELCFQGDQFSNEQKCIGKSINDGKCVTTQRIVETKNTSKKLLRETELLDDAQGLGTQYVTSYVPKCQELKSRNNKFNFKPIRNLPKENSIPPSADIIAGHNSAQTRDIRQRAKVESECKHNCETFFEPELSLIAKEATGKCDKIDDGSYWDDGLCPFSKLPAPITSTQRTEKFLYRKPSQTRKINICTAEEIEKKRAKAMKKLEQRKFKEKHRK